MSTNGLILEAELPAYAGIFTELKPYDNPVTTLVGQKGWRLEPNQNYTYTYHTNSEASAANLKPDNASPTYGSSGFTTGSNTVQIFYEAAQVTWARKGAQLQGRTMGWKGANNPSIEPDPMDRAIAEALGTIKSQLEWVSREGVLDMNVSAGTTGTWQQRGYRYAEGINNQAAAGAVAGAGTLGTYGTLTRDVVTDALQSVWESRLWEGGQAMTCFTNATGKRQLTDMFINEMDFGKNSTSRVEAGVAIEQFTTDFGNVDIVLTHNFPTDTMYLLNLNQMEMVARPVPGMGFLFEKDFGAGNEKANAGKGIYAEIGLDAGVGSAHARIYGVGSEVVGGQTVSAT